MMQAYVIRIYARDMQPGMLIVTPKKDVMIEQIEPGECGKGMHVNVVRRPAFVKRNNKWIPNPEAGLIVHNDGCYDKGMLVQVRIISRDDEVAS